MIKNIAHLCFHVADLDRSLAFYCDKLGLHHAFDFTNEDGERFGTYLAVGGRNFIELFKGEPKRGKGQSYAHMCLEVDDIQTTVAHLRSMGVEVTDVKLGTDHSYQAWLADPDGNRIELHQYTPDSLQAAHV